MQFPKSVDNIDDLRYIQFIKSTKLHKPVQLSNIPPTSAAAYQRINRVYYQVQKWLGYDLEPLEWGWGFRNEFLEPMTTTSPPAPDELFNRLFCNCKNGCGPRCGCRKSGLRCNLACGQCNGQACLNAISFQNGCEEESAEIPEGLETIIETNEDDDDETEFLENPEDEDEEKAINKEEFKKAEQMLHIALKIAQEQNNTDGVTYIYDLMANLAYDTGEFKKAEKLFVIVIERLLANEVAADDNKIIHMSLKLAHIFESYKEYETAETGYMFCLNSFKAKNDLNSEDTQLLWALSLDMYGHFLLSRNRLHEALSALKEAYSKCIQVKGNSQVIYLLNDLALVSNRLGDRDQALRYLEKALQLVKNSTDFEDLELIYINLGQIYFSKEMYKKAEAACLTALEISKNNENQSVRKEANSCLSQIKDALKL